MVKYYYHTHCLIISQGLAVCGGNTDLIASAECRIVGGGSSFTENSVPGGAVFVMDYGCTTLGLHCNDSDIIGGTCADYEVRYTCNGKERFSSYSNSSHPLEWHTYPEDQQEILNVYQV